MTQIGDSIMWAIKNGDLEQVKELIEQNGFNVNQEITARPPIHYAADYGQTDVLRYLINKGANVNVSSFTMQNCGTILKLLFSFHSIQSVDKHGITPILAAIWEGHVNCVRILLEHGADKSGRTPDGTSLIEAAEKQEIRDLLA